MRLKVFSAVVIFIMILFQTFTILAAEREYYLSTYDISVEIKPDGSANVVERLTYSFKGHFNGVTMKLDLSGTGGIKNQRVFMDPAGANGETPQENLQEYVLSQGSSAGEYNFSKDGSYAFFKVYQPSDSQKRTFVYKYTLIDAVTVYKDVGEFNRKMIGTAWETRIENISVKIRLPYGASKDQIRVFGHGPLTGESSIEDGSRVAFRVPAISPGTFVETRVLFPVNLVPDARRFINRDVLQEILKSEGKLAEEANLQREKARQQLEDENERRTRLMYIGTAITILLFLFWFFLIFFIYFKFDREFKHSFSAKYFRELPGEYSPAEMSVLMSFGSVQPRDITATLMDLVRRRILVLIPEKVHKKGLFGGKDVTEYLFRGIEGADLSQLKQHETFLLSWFVNKLGDGFQVKLDDVKNYVRRRSNALQFKSDYDRWKAAAAAEAGKNNFFDLTSKKGKIIGILVSIVYLAAGFVLPALMYAFAAVILGIQGVILLIFSARLKRRTKYGSEQHAMWDSFRRFLKDFSNLEKAGMPSVIMWEHYLVYAISLGVAKEVIKQLPLVLREEELNNESLTFMYAGSYGYMAGFSRMFDDTISTVNEVINSAASIANSANSSSSGSGGGFSGGSSGGGGGGSGGGAF